MRVRGARRRPLAVSAVVAATVVAVGAAAPSGAAADPSPVRCSDLSENGSSVVGAHVVGDFLADSDDGSGCFLRSATITGDVLATAYTVAEASTVGGTVTVVDGHLTLAYGASVGGDVVMGDLAYPWLGLSLVASTVAGSVHGQAGSVYVGEDSTVEGDYDLTTSGVVRIRHSTVAGDVDSRGGRLLVHDATVGGRLTATGSAPLVCRTTVGGDLTVTDAHAYARLGIEGRERCRTTVGGSVRVVDNTHSVDLGDLVVAGDLVCTGNTGPRLVTWTALTSVAGTRTGQCA